MTVRKAIVMFALLLTPALAGAQDAAPEDPRQSLARATSPVASPRQASA